MENEELKKAIDDYSDAAESAIVDLNNRLSGVEGKLKVPTVINHDLALNACLSALNKVYSQTGTVLFYQEDGEHMLTESQYKALKKQVEDQTSNAKDTPLLLEGGLKVATVDMSNQIAPLLEAIKYHEAELAKKRPKDDT